MCCGECLCVGLCGLFVLCVVYVFVVVGCLVFFEFVLCVGDDVCCFFMCGCDYCGCVE